MAKKIKKNLLHQHWIHSREEDTATEMVFRPASYDFPLARGRKSFEINSDGTLINYGMSPTDREEETEGVWKLEDGGQLAFYADAQAEPNQKLQIVSVDEERLVVKKPG